MAIVMHEANECVSLSAAFGEISLFKVIVGHTFETSIKCLCFIRSQ